MHGDFVLKELIFERRRARHVARPPRVGSPHHVYLPARARIVRSYPRRTTSNQWKIQAQAKAAARTARGMDSLFGVGVWDRRGPWFLLLGSGYSSNVNFNPKRQIHREEANLPPKWSNPLRVVNSARRGQFRSEWSIPLGGANSAPSGQFRSEWSDPLGTFVSAPRGQIRSERSLQLPPPRHDCRIF